MAEREENKGNILIVDDTPDNLQMLTRILIRRGYQVRPAINAHLALKAVHHKLPDLILLDIMMPDIDGYEVCRQLKANARTRDIPILFISALYEEEDKVKAFEVGGVDFITKPFSTEEVLARVETHIALRNMQKQWQDQNLQLQEEMAERKKAEEERRQLEARLRQSQRLEAIGTLAGGIAHDFNNILSSMMGYIEVLLDNQEEESDEKLYLERVYRIGERAADLVQQILIFSRSQEQELVPTLVTPLLSETLKLLRATIPANIEFRQNIPDECRPIMADATQINQVLMNLCVNASHAIGEQVGVIEVTLEEIETGHTQNNALGLNAGPYLKLSVKDTGCGMPAEIQEHIFDPFFTTKGPGQGTGLGLSVVHSIVKGHGGHMTFSSQPEQGTEFQIFFPIIEGLNVQHHTSPKEKAPRGEGSILIVDDESDLADLYELALNKLGYQVTVCHDGEEALRIFTRQPDAFDLVFTDQAMPQITGEQLSRELLRLKPNLPIILATGYSENISEENADSLGIRRFLRKPVKILTLVQTIQHILKEQDLSVT